MDITKDYRGCNYKPCLIVIMYTHTYARQAEVEETDIAHLRSVLDSLKTRVYEGEAKIRRLQLMVCTIEYLQQS